MGLYRHQPQVLLRQTAALFVALALLAPACRSPTPRADFHFTCPAGDPLRGIYSPKRLEVLGTCVTFDGTVLTTDRRSDGDLHVLLRPDPDYTHLLNVENVNEGGMVVEIVPGQAIPPPTVGEHVRVFGTWVLDEHNGRNEIHPVWAIEDLTTGVGTQALPPDPPQYTGDSND